MSLFLLYYVTFLFFSLFLNYPFLNRMNKHDFLCTTCPLGRGTKSKHVDLDKRAFYPLFTSVTVNLRQ